MRSHSWWDIFRCPPSKWSVEGGWERTDRSRRSFCSDLEGIVNNTMRERGRLREAYLSFGGVACCVAVTRRLSFLRREEIQPPAALRSSLGWEELGRVSLWISGKGVESSRSGRRRRGMVDASVSPLVSPVALLTQPGEIKFVPISRVVESPESGSQERGRSRIVDARCCLLRL